MVVCVALALGGCTPFIFANDSANHQGQATHSQSSGDAAQAQHDALDKYVAAGQHQLPALLAASKGLYSKISIDAEYPDTVDYSYVYAHQIDAVAAKNAFDSMVAKFKTACDTQLFPDMKRAGITASQGAKYSYFNADGSEIWSRSFTSSD